MVLAALILVTACALPTTAQAAERSPVAQRLIEWYIKSDELRTPAGRAKFVQDADAYCMEVGRLYPRNSPAENSWLDAEIQAGGNRTLRSIASPEAGRRFAANFVSGCHSFAKTYPTNQVGALIGIAAVFLQFSDDARMYARKNGVDGKFLLFGEVSGDRTLRMVTKAALDAALAEQALRP